MARSRSITSVNAQIMFTIPLLFPIPQQLEGFAAEDIFDTEAIEAGEAVMGLDGFLSAGFVPMPIKQGYTIQANSPSVDFFESWYAAEQASRDKYFAQGVIVMPGIGRTYAMVSGVLIGYSPMADGKKVLQPRKFGVVWESAIGAPL